MYVINFETELCKIPVWIWDMYILYQFYVPFVCCFVIIIFFKKAASGS